MDLVYIEVPFLADYFVILQQYSYEAVQDSLYKNEMPFCPTTCYPPYSLVNGTGSKSAEEMLSLCSKMIVYIDLGLTNMNKLNITIAEKKSIPVEYRRLNNNFIERMKTVYDEKVIVQMIKLIVSNKLPKRYYK